MIVIIIKYIIRVPDILRSPVVERGGTPDILELLRDPAFSLVAEFLIQKSAVSLQRLIRPYSQKTDRLPISMRDLVPPPELLRQILLVHPVTVGRDRIMRKVDHIFLLRHLPDPQLFLLIIPRIPVHLITAESRPGRHWKAYPVRLYYILNPLKCTLHIFCRHGILCFKVLMKDTDPLIYSISLLKIQHQIQQESAVLSARKRNVNIVKFLKNKPQPFLKGFINILSYIFPYHIHLPSLTHELPNIGNYLNVNLSQNTIKFNKIS